MGYSKTQQKYIDLVGEGNACSTALKIIHELEEISAFKRRQLESQLEIVSQTSKRMKDGRIFAENKLDELQAKADNLQEINDKLDAIKATVNEIARPKSQAHPR